MAIINYDSEIDISINKSFNQLDTNSNNLFKSTIIKKTTSEIEKELIPYTETRIVYGEKDKLELFNEILLGCKKNYDIYCEKNNPIIVNEFPLINEAYSKLKNNGVKIRYLTEITTDNLKQIKWIMNNIVAEIRHFDKIKGNFMVSDSKFYVTTSILEKKKSNLEIICSNAKGLVEQNQFLFETMWKNAVPASQRIREIEEDYLPSQTKILDNNTEIYDQLTNLIEKTNRGILICSSIEGFKLLLKNKTLYQSYINLFTRIKEGKVNGRVRWITFIENKTEDIELIKTFLEIGTEIKHVKNLPPLSFGISERQFEGTIEKMINGEMIRNILHSTEPLYILHFQSLFVELWKVGIDAKKRINQIENDIADEMTTVIENPYQAKNMFIEMIENAKEEIMIVFPSYNVIKRLGKTEVIKYLMHKSQERINIRILSPINEEIKKILITKQIQGKKSILFEYVHFQEISKRQDIKSIILMIDKKRLLAMELKDDVKERFDEMIGLSTYSTSKPTILSNISIFESLWRQTDLYEKLKLNSNMQKEFIDAIAHELRTPLTPIIGLTTYVRGKIKNEEQVELLDIVIDAGKKLHILGENILDLTKIEGKMFNLKKERFDIAQLILKTVNEITHSINKDKKILFEYVNFGKYIVFVDKQRISQVIFNLLDNAIKFILEKEGGLISIIFEKKYENEKGIIIVHIKDNGEGIHPDIIPRLFNKFATKSFYGSGLGLYICKNIIDMHNGKIWAFNNIKEKGATFSFSLRLIEK